MQHAHQKAVIHRDLKPSNILVAEVDGKPWPQIIDFGVAKAMTQRLTAETLYTHMGALIGTPAYMSPEQASSGSQDIDTRSDVYSLGVVLYELLAGAPPLELRTRTFDEFLRALRENEPPKPSTKIRTPDLNTSMELARSRGGDPQLITKQVRGDLDSIVLKALEKDRSRRYGSASDFAEDIARFLRNEAVIAVPPSAAYRARKFCRRYRAVLATSAAFAFVVIMAAGISILQTIRARALSDFFVKAAESVEGAKSGNGDIAFVLGTMYSAGLGVPRDDVQAVRWYRKAADAGNTMAMSNLGFMFHNGHGVRKDDVQAVRWLRKAADTGNTMAMVNLGLMYDQGLGGLPKDDMQAVSWYRKAAEAGSPRAVEALKRLKK